MITNPTINSTLFNTHQGLFLRRQKSLDASYIDKIRKVSGLLIANDQRLLIILGHAHHWYRFDIEHAVARILTKSPWNTTNMTNPNVLKDTSTQALLLTVLAILRRHTSNENENEN
ncbi:unnamed protein product [Rotaria sordida]|uniref:Uncharacterized protein n=1 Tax=Rotaria sordida TaxID=392033 RepID=A0A815NBY0_9BILA|nr:unnamed protein product [Rotaria sordida]